jgi:hypothetical protein
MDQGVSFAQLLILLPIIFMWFAVLLHILRRHDLTGGKIAMWLILIIILPIVGSLIYFISLGTDKSWDTRQPGQAPERDQL